MPFLGRDRNKLKPLTTANFKVTIQRCRTGDVVPELGSLSALQTLSLRDNHLTNAIPPELGRLTALNHLFFNNNKLRGEMW